MPSEQRATFHLRLEDAVALVFFVINLAVRLIFRGFERRHLGPADVLVVIPAVCLLIAKELVHYFVMGEKDRVHAAVSPKEFVRPYWEIFRDWFPFLVILLMYYSLWGDATHLLITRDRDAELIALEQRLFGFQASLALQPFISPPLTAWMQFAYFFHLLNIPIVACFIYVWRPRARFREMMCGLIVIFFFGLLGYVLVPAIGPVYTLRDQYTVPLTQSLEVFTRQMEFMDFARIQRDVFPSMHTAVSFIVWLYAYRNSRRLFVFLAPFVISLWISTVYLRYHYLVDVVAGLVLAPFCFYAANWLFKRFGMLPLAVALPAGLSRRLAGRGAAGTSSSATANPEERR